MDPHSQTKLHPALTDVDGHYPGSPLTLCFEDQKLEAAYKAHRPMKPTAKLISQRVPFSLVFYLVIGLEAVAAAGSYGEERGESWTLYIQLIVLGVLALLGSVGMLAITLMQTRFKKAAYAILLIMSAVALSIVDERFAVQVSGGEFRGSMTSSFLPVLILTVCAVSVLQSHFITYIACSIACMATQLAFQLGGVRTASGVIDSCFYLILSIWFSSIVYSNEKHMREAFCHEMAEFTCVGKDDMVLESWTSTDETLGTEFERIVKELQQSYRLISEVWTLNMVKDGRIKLKEALRKIFEAGKVLKSGRNIHEPFIGLVSKQLDSEYKHYLEQNYLTPRVHDPAHKGTIKPSDQHINYAAKDLIPMLSQLEKNWNFDMFFLAQVSGFRPLETTGEFFIKKYALDTHLRLVEGRSLAFFRMLEMKYKPNPYHNSTHAADVLNSLLFLYKHSLIFSNMTELELLGSIIAALGHDVGHPAFNNRYLISTKSSFALIYNDSSVLENMHAALTYELLEETKLLETLDKDQWVKTRKVTVDMILATDMMKHFDLVGNFRVKYAEKEFPLSNFEERVGVYKMCIKCADVAHAAKAVELHEKWSLKVVQEFFHQGDLEREQDLEISAYCDRLQSDVPKSQSGFIVSIVRPMYEALNSLLKSEDISKACVDQFEVNIHFWNAHGRSSKRHHTVKEPKLRSEEEKEAIAKVTLVKSNSGDLPEIVEDSH